MNDKFGIILFWFVWPLQWVYFKRNPIRSRVLIVCEDEVLLIKNRIGLGVWTLPGGGVKTGEGPEESIVRELKEELGIELVQTELTYLGKRNYKKSGLYSKTINYTVTYSEKPNIILKKLEISAYKWIKISEIDLFEVSPETIFALKRYKPVTQEQLL